jgi:ectoine hydroxylase-related dioxygenase (phytanoyl-CoA dioxygenase family)
VVPQAATNLGYRILPGVFSPDEVASLLEALARARIARTRAGARHLLGQPAVAAIANDSRLCRIAQNFLNADPLAFRATLFDKSVAANWLVAWHQDTALPLRERRQVAGWGPWSVKAGVNYAHAPASALERVVALRLHLDDSTPENGPLRVLPETHTRRVLSDEAVAVLAARITPVECVVPRGGVVAMRPLLVHASSKSRSTMPRRVLHIEYAESASLAPGLELAVV